VGVCALAGVGWGLGLFLVEMAVQKGGISCSQHNQAHTNESPWQSPKSSLFLHTQCIHNAHTMHPQCARNAHNPSHYHASLSHEERERVQAAWSRDELQVIVATIAFGMGALWGCGLLGLV